MECGFLFMYFIQRDEWQSYGILGNVSFYVTLLAVLGLLGSMDSTRRLIGRAVNTYVRLLTRIIFGKEGIQE
jgi:hypothetical protein